jgi:hypothetical protein
MTGTGNTTEGLCQECSQVVKLTQNPLVLAEIRRLEIGAEGYMSQYLKTKERIEILTRTLNPVEVEAKPKWIRGETSHECRECKRATRWFLGATPRCYPKCVERKGKLGIEEYGVADMIRSGMLEMLSIDEGDDNDIEFIKKGAK